MVWEWVKKNYRSLLTACVIVGFLFYAYGCEPKVPSLNNKTQMITRAELQIELDQIIANAELKFAALEQQEKLRALILQNALILVQGQPLNPVGILMGIAGIYGFSQAGHNVTTAVKRTKEKRKNG